MEREEGDVKEESLEVANVPPPHLMVKPPGAGLPARYYHSDCAP